MRYRIANLTLYEGQLEHELGSARAYPPANLGSGDVLGQYEYQSENRVATSKQAYDSAVKTGSQAQIEKAFEEYNKALEAYQNEAPLREELERLYAQQGRDVFDANIPGRPGYEEAKARTQERSAKMEALWPGWEKWRLEYEIWTYTGGIPDWYRDLQEAGATAFDIALQLLPFAQQARGMRIPMVRPQIPRFRAPVPTLGPVPVRPSVPTVAPVEPTPKVTYPQAWPFTETPVRAPVPTVAPPPGYIRVSPQEFQKLKTYALQFKRDPVTGEHFYNEAQVRALLNPPQRPTTGLEKMTAEQMKSLYPSTPPATTAPSSPKEFVPLPKGVTYPTNWVRTFYRDPVTGKINYDLYDKHVVEMLMKEQGISPSTSIPMPTTKRPEMVYPRQKGWYGQEGPMEGGPFTGDKKWDPQGELLRQKWFPPEKTEEGSIYTWPSAPQSKAPTGSAPVASTDCPLYSPRDAQGRCIRSGSLPALPGGMLTGALTPANRFALSPGLGTRALGG